MADPSLLSNKKKMHWSGTFEAQNISKNTIYLILFSVKWISHINPQNIIEYLNVVQMLKNQCDKAKHCIRND